MLIISLLCFSTVAILLLTYRTIWSLTHFRHRPVTKDDTTDSFPTVSICIAARNETHALAQCLENVLRSDYPKLEVLVLDDSSNDDTSLIIKSFARAGVRFVAGSTLPQGWLGKNYAYQTLISESSGDYLLFLDVDTVISTSTIHRLIEQVLSKERAMISVLPRREDSYRSSAILGTMRYFWELILSSRSNPPASGSIWMVKRSALTESNVGMADYSMSVRPERHLASQLQAKKQYMYLIGNRKLGVSYEKRLKSQYDTALRLYYPMTGKRFVSWFAASVFIVLLILPLFVALSGTDNIAVWLWSVCLVVSIVLTFGLFIYQSYGSIGWVMRLSLGPLLLIQELTLLTASYILYRLNKVSWKGRPVAAQPNRHDALHIDE